jgi:AraC-like DNA-binding protein
MMLLYFSLMGLFMALLLFCFGFKMRRSTVYLAIFFILISIFSIQQYVLLYSKSEFWVALTYINFSFLSYLIGPAFFIYIRSIVKDNPDLKKVDLWHLVPVVLFLLPTLPYIFTSWPHKVGIASMIIRDTDFLGTYQPTLMHRLFSNSFVYLSRPLSVFIYLLCSVALFIRYFHHGWIRSVLVPRNQLVKWISILMTFLFILLISYIIVLNKSFLEKDSDLFFTVNFFHILAGMGFFGLFLSIFFFPEILYGLPQSPPDAVDFIPAENTFTGVNDKDSHKFHMEEAYLHLIDQKVSRYMNEVQPYLRNDFNLNYLSVQTSIPLHQLSFYFKNTLKRHFGEYRNEYRINFAKKLIIEGRNKDFTMETIGFQSGFSSRNTFYVTFKKFERISPGDYAVHCNK